MSGPSEKPELVQPQAPGSSKGEFTNGPGSPFKRPVVEDEIEFISCNPVKKRKVAEPTTVHSTNTSMGPSQLQNIRSADQDIKDIPQRPPISRCRSLCDTGQAKAPGPEAATESRGTSLPVLEKFAFPQTFPPATGRPPRISDAISPKQLPQPLPALLEPGTSCSEAGTNTVNTASTTQTHAQTPIQANSVTLDQASCLDLRGIPTTSPVLDAGRAFSAGGGIMSKISIDNTASSATPLAPPIPASSLHSGIPFTIYSTGGIITMIQPQNGDKPSVPALARGAKPTSCPHCARLRQQNPFHQPPVSGTSTRITTQTHGHASSLGHGHTASRRSVPPRLSGFTTPCYIPRSGPVAGQEQRPPPSQHQHQFPQPPSQHPPHPSLASPNYYHLRPLLQDMAQTIQASFPYAQVAARHGMAPARVAEVLASVVGAPLVSRRE
ncbi:hypothetical protein VTH06DRAFT_4095 [Thermothelomyces fergusii]